MLKRMTSLILALALVITMLPVTAFAEETESTETAVEETVAAETTVPVEETTEPAETATEATEGTTAPTEAATEPDEETTVPSEEPTDPTEGTTAPAEDAIIPTETISNECFLGVMGAVGDNLIWMLDDAGTLTISGTGTMADYTSSNTAPWYDYISVIKHVVVEDGVTSIGDCAFYRCASMESISLPDGLTGIGTNAFHYCLAMTEIAIPESVKIIEDYAFRMSGLTGISIPQGVTAVGTYAFTRCDSLTQVTVPSSVTSIGDHAFEYCPELESITVDQQNQNYASVDGVFFDKNCQTLLAYPGGRAGEYTIPEGVGRIEVSAFYIAEKLTSVTIPESVHTIGVLAFDQCSSLSEIIFRGDAPAIDSANYANPEVFYGVTATAYYPEENSTWTDEVREKFGREASLTWLPYTLEDTPKTCRMEDLSDLDYMAFAQVAYNDFKLNETVQACLTRKNKWNKEWGTDGITYAELCSKIAQWRVCASKSNGGNGFYAVAFENDYNEAVIAYRGSMPPSQKENNPEAFWNDWWDNDLQMIIFNTDTGKDNQYQDAINFFETVRKEYGAANITVTGHSLGGLWGSVASVYSGCRGVTFNTISALDVMLISHPEDLGENYAGVERWNFRDHVNWYDIAAGATEIITNQMIFGTKLKPYISYKSNFSATSVGKNHSMNSYVSRIDGIIQFNEKDWDWCPTEAISLHQDLCFKSLDLGISGSDSFKKGLSMLTSRTSYGGMGDDNIYSSIFGDCLLGGKGNDTLDGGRGDDTYIYFKGDGRDCIYDVSGEDKIRLVNFSYDDEIEARSYEDSDYINILCNGETIIEIHKKYREYRYKASDHFVVSVEGKTDPIDITDLFSKKAYDSHVVIQCPVNVEILDPDGNVVYTLVDGEEGIFYTDYGNFYVFQEEDGGYGKTLDLIDGYTARIVGYDDGTMKIDYREVVDGELAEPRNFVDVPVSAQFSATFEETEDGELVLAADTNGDGTVDAKIGYDGSVIACEEITVSEEYIVLQPGDEVPLHAEVLPGELTDLMVWSVEEGSEAVVSVDETGVVTALDVGTGYVLATVKTGDSEIIARCRVDVAETETVGEEEKIILDGVQLGTTKLTSELFSTDYAEFDVLLKLPQNMNFQSLDESVIPESNSVAIEDIYFTASTTKVAFDLVALDDRRVAVVPTKYAVEYPEELAKTYKSRVTIVVQGKEYTTEDELTLTLKQSKPKLKATIPAFNSFYDYQTQAIKVTGGTVTGITLNPDKTQPDWLTLNEDGTLSLNGNAAQKSGKVYLLVETEEWRIPAEITLTVKNARKTPGLKLSASSVKMAEDAASSSGVALKLLPKSKKDTLSSLNVTGITSQTAGYSVTGFNPETGAFTLKAESGFKTGKVTLNVTFSNTSEVLPLTVKVSVQKVSLKLSARTVTLNKAIDDSAVVSITAAPADYILTAPTIEGNEAGLFDLSYENGKLTIHPTDAAEAGKTYKLSISAGGSKKVTLSVKVIDAEPTLTLKAKGNIDLSFPDRAATITATFKNYASGAIKDYTTVVTAPDGTTSEDFTISRDGTVFTVTTTNTDIATGSYRLTLKLALPNGTELENTVKLTVKRTAVKLKLAPAKLTLNKTIADKASVAVSCTTKGYEFSEPVWQLMDKSGKNSAEGALDIAWSDGKLNIAVNDNTAYGATYKLLVKANAYAPAATLTITVPTEAKSAIKSSLKAKGTIDVIRAGTAVTITPGYKNCGTGTVGTEELLIYSSADKYAAPVNDLFYIEKDAQGRYILTAAEGLDHSKTYKAELVTTFGETKVTSARVALKVKMGSAKLTLTADGNILFANDKNSRVDFTLTAKDASLNEIQEVSIKADRKGYDQMLEVIPYGNGEFAIGFKDETVDRSLIGKTVTVTLNVKLTGNETAKVNATAKLRLTILK